MPVKHTTILCLLYCYQLFALLLHFCHLANISCNVLMVSPIQGRSVLDINASGEKHRAVLPILLADTVSQAVILWHHILALGRAKLAEAMPVCQNCVPWLLLLKHLRKMLLELIFSWQSGNHLRK